MNKIILIVNIILIALFSSCKKGEVLPTHEVTYRVEFLTPFNPQYPNVPNEFTIKIKHGHEVYSLNNKTTVLGTIWEYTYKLEKNQLVDIYALGKYKKYRMSVYVDGVEVSYKVIDTSVDKWSTEMYIIEEGGIDENIKVGYIDGLKVFIENDNTLPEISFIL